MSARSETARLRLERDEARDAIRDLTEELRLVKSGASSDMVRLAARVEKAEAMLRAHGVNPGPWCRPMPPSEWLERQNLQPDHPVRKRQGIIL